MIIDFHTHIFPDRIAEKTIKMLSEKGGIPPFSNGSTEGLLNAMEIAGTDISVTLPVLTNPSQFDSVNSFAAEIRQTFPELWLSLKKRVLSKRLPERREAIAQK